VIAVLRNVLLVLEPSPHAERALTEAIDLAEAGSGRLTILTPVPDPQRWAGPAEAYAACRQLADDLDHELRELQEAALRRVPDDLPVTTVLTRRRVGAALLTELASGCHDVVLIGGRPRGVLRTALFGGVSARALRRCGLPVLMVRADGATDALEPPEAGNAEALAGELGVGPVGVGRVEVTPARGHVAEHPLDLLAPPGGA
jgi:nucleotide-binding universal stress UspA family protein